MVLPLYFLLVIQAQWEITTSSLRQPPSLLNLKAKPWESTSQTSGLPVIELWTLNKLRHNQRQHPGFVQWSQTELVYAIFVA
jgi:hypothetical protein